MYDGTWSNELYLHTPLQSLQTLPSALPLAKIQSRSHCPDWLAIVYKIGTRVNGTHKASLTTTSDLPRLAYSLYIQLQARRSLRTRHPRPTVLALTGLP